MAIYLFFICFCLHGFVYRGVDGLEHGRHLNIHHNDSTMIPNQRGLGFSEHLVKKAAQASLDLKSYFASYYHLYDEDSQFGRYTAVYNAEPASYYGTKATINVWGFSNIDSNQIMSSANIWVENRGDDSRERWNKIEVGWHVYPAYYEDIDTHFFIHWTADGFQNTGCFNLDCPGFVFVNKSQFVPGNKLSPVSKYEGEQYEITLKIYKDPQTGDWLLFEGIENAPNFVGYWPKSLFTGLANFADTIVWGGYAVHNKIFTSPPMGSGHFPEEGERKAAWFKNVQYVDNKGNLFDPSGDEGSVVTKGDCYNASPFVYSGEGDGWKFYFGGPSDCKN